MDKRPASLDFNLERRRHFDSRFVDSTCSSYPGSVLSSRDIDVLKAADGSLPVTVDCDREALPSAPAATPMPYAYPCAPPNTVEELRVDPSMRVFAPSNERNKGPILEVLKRFLPQPSTSTSNGTHSISILEVACGTGQHAAVFSQALPHCLYHPTDYVPVLFDSITAHCQGLPNVKPPALLDIQAPEESWPSPSLPLTPASMDTIVCINMTHISPWDATLGLLKGARAYIRPGGLLFLYGPFTEDYKFTSESNAAFDTFLRSKDDQWGYRDIKDVSESAQAQELDLVEVIHMPAHNFMLVFRRKSK